MKIIEKKDEYFAKIIHDLKTPANAQARALESLLETCSKKINQEEKDLIELTLNSCNYMQNLIEVFCSVYKLNYEKIELNYEKFDIIKLINDTIKELRVLLKYHELNLAIKSSHKAIIVNADKLQIKRVIENILSNEIEHAFKNSIIEIELIKNKSSFIFHAKNKSKYIEPKALKEIFEKFKTNYTSTNRIASGLGLYLSKEIIKAHFGKMIAKSYSNDTNIFGFSIPI